MIQNVQILAQNEPLWQEKDWKKQLSAAISEPKELLEHLGLAIEQLPYPVDLAQKFPQKVPMPFVDRMEKNNPFDPLLLQVLPLSEENQLVSGFTEDPLQEQKSIIPGLLHKYQSRILFMLATHCAINCRYCFRREFPYHDNRASRRDWDNLTEYLSKNPEINEVIISGGDPLAVNDQYLSDFVEQIEQVKTVKRLRIHSRLPIVIPQRVTEKLLQLAKKTRLQLVMVTHVNHPNELDDKVKNALLMLDKAGFSLLNQSVLLKNINDSAEVLALLSERLFECKVQPYYLYLLDKVSGSHHFEVSQVEAVIIMKQLQKMLAGFLVPKLAREEANKASKTLINLTK